MQAEEDGLFQAPGSGALVMLCCVSQASNGRLESRLSRVEIAVHKRLR
jgi:hypothetical protein